MQEITELTKKQEAKLVEYRDLFINKFFNNEKEADFEEVKNYVLIIFY